MVVLIVEDDVNKSKNLFECVRQILPAAKIVERRSYRSGLKELVDSPPDLVLLDMSLPTFDVTSKDKGGRPRGFAGRDIMEEVSRRRLSIRALVVTQYPVFGEGKDKKTLEQLRIELRTQFPRMFLGAVYYHPAQSDWKSQLEEAIGHVQKEVDHNADNTGR